MHTSFKRLIALLFLAALVGLVSTGCNTAHGFGKDVTSTGDAIQHGTD